MKPKILPLKLLKFFTVFVLVYSPNIYNQTLTAEQIYKKVSDAVVVLHAYDYNNNLVKQGSGVVLNDKGYIVSNYHVLAGCERLEILHKEETVPYVDIIGIDVEKDILILKIEAKKFSAIKIGDSKRLNIGQRVYAIGSPLGFENTISEGIISGLRSYKEIGKNFIQITASISPGSSGGAVVNDKGELIGISTLTAYEGQNLNFAIPINVVFSIEINSYSKDDAYKGFEWFFKGQNADREKDYDKAIKYYSHFLKIYPNHAGAYNNRGIAKEELEDYTGAIQDYSKAIDVNPKFADAYYNRGITKYNLKDFMGAIQDYNKAIGINPSYEEAYFNRGIAKENLEDYRGAIQDYSKAIDVNPKYVAAYINCSKVKIYVGDYRGAIQDCNNAIVINPNYETIYNNRGSAKQSLKDYKGALQDYNKAISINPKYEEAYINRGNVKLDLVDNIGALLDYKKVIELNPNNPYAYMNTGMIKYSIGDTSGACLAWSKAGELGLDDAYEYIRAYCN